MLRALFRDVVGGSRPAFLQGRAKLALALLWTFLVSRVFEVQHLQQLRAKTLARIPHTKGGVRLEPGGIRPRRKAFPMPLAEEIGSFASLEDLFVMRGGAGASSDERGDEVERSEVAMELDLMRALVGWWREEERSGLDHAARAALPASHSSGEGENSAVAGRGDELHTAVAGGDEQVHQDEGALRDEDVVPEVDLGKVADGMLWMEIAQALRVVAQEEQGGSVSDHYKQSLLLLCADGSCGADGGGELGPTSRFKVGFLIVLEIRREISFFRQTETGDILGTFSNRRTGGLLRGYARPRRLFGHRGPLTRDGEGCLFSQCLHFAY